MLGAVVSSSEWSSEAMSMRQPALALQLRGQRAAAPEQGGELKRSLYHRLPSSPRAHLSLEAPCQHAVPATPMSLADQQAARTHLQVVAPAKSHEHGDWAGSAVAGQRARCRLCPRPCCLCRVSPSHALTDGIMFADHGRAWSPDVLGTDLRHRHPRQRCLGRHQGHRGGQRRRCAPPACDLGTGCWSAVSRARWLGSRAEPRMRASWLRDRAHPGAPAPLVLGRAPWRFGADAKACCSFRDEIRHAIAHSVCERCNE